MPITYPQRPQDKQYGDAFPWIDERGLPTKEDWKEIIESHRTLQPSEGSSETLAQPVGLEFGALDVWVKKGSVRSWAYDDGPFPSDDYLKRQPLTPVREFCFAPGVDDADTGEKAMEIGFKLHGKPNVKAARLELYCRGHKEPIWTRAWGGAWEKKDAEVGELPGEACGVGEWKGSIPWSEVKVDTALKIGEETAFPDGVLTALRSPYQLRLVVSGKKAKEDPPEADRYAYPSVAWTYVHVLLHSITVEAGDLAWTGTDRPDIHDDFREKVVGKRDQKEGKTDYGLEGQTFDEVKQRFDEKAELKPVSLQGTIIKKGGDLDFFTYYERMWGKGPRIPLAATAKVRTTAGAPTDVNLAKVCKGLKLLWDWSDDPGDPTQPLTEREDDPLETTSGRARSSQARSVSPPKPWAPRWRGATETDESKHRGGAVGTNAYLEKIYAQGADFQPRGSFNCPVFAGGKHGDDASPVFHEQSPKGDGKGTLPFEVKRCATRTWAVLSEFDDQGKTGVIFQPSRLPGDVYRVRAYPFVDPSLDSHDPIDPAQVLHGYAGRFEVFRRVDLQHLVVGALADAIDVNEMASTYRQRLRKQVNIDLRGGTTQIDPTTYKDVLAETLKRIREGVFGHVKISHFPVGADMIIKRTGPGKQFLTLRTPTEARDNFRRFVTTGRARLAKKTMYPALAGDDLKAAYLERLLCDGKGATVYQLHSHTPDAPGEPGYVKDKRQWTHTWVVTADGEPTVADGDAVKGEATKAAYSLQLEASRSCRDREYRDAPSSSKDMVRVTFPGVDPVELKYKKAKMSLSLSPDLTDEHRTALRDALKQAGAAFNEVGTLSIVVAGRQDSSNSRKRVANVKAFLDVLFDKERIVIDRSALAEAALDNIEVYKTLRTWRELFFRFTTIGQVFVEAYLDHKRLSPRTVLLLHAARASNLATFPEAETLGGKGTDPTKLLETAAGGSVPGYRPDELDSGYIQLLTPDATDPLTDNSSPQKSPASVVVHEVGHGLFIPEHAPRLDGSAWVNADGADPKVHVTGDHCVMSYDKDTHQFCGLCMLRLRGWRYQRFDTTGERVVKATIGFGDWDAPFLDADNISKEVGGLARLQVLNLFNRPLSMRDDDTLNRKAEFLACAEFSRKHAKDAAGLSIDLPALVKGELAKFVCEAPDVKGEAFPTGTARKLRIFGGFHLIYANSDIELRCRETGDELFKDGHPEEEYGLETPDGREGIQAEYLDANPAIGCVPLAVRVVDAAGKGIGGLPVVVRLIAPGPAETYAEGFGGAALSGATTYNKTTGAPAPHADAKGYLETHVDGLEPSTDDCPIKGNAHAKLGGKRELVAGGDVTSVGPNGERNLFVPLPGSGLTAFPRPKDPSDTEIPWAVGLTTNDAGEAGFLFCPAPIGGDRYRLAVEVKDPLDPRRDLTTYETGDIVVWRTIRVCRHLQMPNAASTKELPAPLKKYLELNNVDLERTVRPLDVLDVKHLAKELARGYVDCLVEKKALQPESFGKEHWDDFLEELRRHTEAFPSVVNCSTWIGERRRFEVALTPDKVNKKRVFRGRFPASVVPDTLYLTSGEPDMVQNANPLSAFAHSYDVDADEFGVATLSKLEANAPVLGNDKERKSGAVIAIDAAKDKSFVNLGTGEVQVTFTADQTGPFKAGAQLKGVFDVSKLLTFPATSPFFFSLRAPADYNKAIKGTGRVELPDVKGEGLVEKCIRHKPFGLTQGAMLQALHHSIGGNGQSYYPGLVIMHAQHMDPYTLCFDAGLEGKGIGNGVVVFNYLTQDAAKTLKLLVHEASHCMYFVHSHMGPRKDPDVFMARHHKSKAQCVMNYDEPRPDNNNGGYCGKCLASLRGIPVKTGELKDKV